jgi:hypothetical protein
MNVKERIIRARIARLDPETDTEEIGALKAQLVPPAPPSTPEEAKAPEIPSPLVEQRSVPPAADVEPHSHPLAENHKSDTLSEEPTALAVGSSRRVEEFRALNTEVHIRSRKWGDIWIVPRRTGAARFELLPEEMLMLSWAGEAFGAKVVEVRQNVPARL